MRMNNSQVLAKVRIMTTQMEKVKMTALLIRGREGLVRVVCASESHATIKAASLAQIPSVKYVFFR